MIRTVTAHLECEVVTPVEIALSVAAAVGPELVSESLVVTLDGADVEMSEIVDDHGTRLHVGTCGSRGSLVVDYGADVGSLAPPQETRPVDLVRYLRPSRYCESDRLSPVARAEFAGLDGADLVSAVSTWVRTRLGYVPGSSRPIDGAVATLLARQGVCRDFAHLVIAFLRACDVPARLASVYAPGLSPMDFHAVAEAYVDGCWSAVDATGLAPRSTMLRIATGRDAADTAFLTNSRGIIVLTGMEVVAYTDERLPFDDVNSLAELR
ncbi:MAG: transglutaminase protein [Ilumatobacteraceae bacterium]|nr:transglutaminase protein [Ilumatobacteraceae bacterium]